MSEHYSGKHESYTLEHLSCELVRIESLILALDDHVRRSHIAEMLAIDAQTNDLGKQLAEIAAGLTGNVTSTQIERMRAVIDKLKQIGKIATPSPNPNPVPSQ